MISRHGIGEKDMSNLVSMYYHSERLLDVEALRDCSTYEKQLFRWRKKKCLEINWQFIFALQILQSRTDRTHLLSSQDIPRKVIVLIFSLQGRCLH